MAAGKTYHWKHGWIPLDGTVRRRPTAAHPSDPNKVWNQPGPRGTPMAHTRIAVRPSKPRPVVARRGSRRLPDLQKEIEANGGFTYDPKTNGLLKVGEAKGFAVAVPGTEQTVGKESVSRDDFAKGVAAVVTKHSDKIAKGAVIGGWYSPDRGEYMVELTEIHPPDDRAGAIAAGIERNQEAIFDLATGETINTGGTGDAGLKKEAMASG